MTSDIGGLQERPQEHAPEVAGSSPAPAPSRTRPDSPRGKSALAGGTTPRGRDTARPRPPQATKQTERDFQNQIIALAQLCGWRVAHFRPAQNARGDWRTPVAADGKGFFDLVLMRERVIFAELKTDLGRLTPDQHAWREAATRAGAITAVWRPRDWGDIEALLQRPAAPALVERR